MCPYLYTNTKKVFKEEKIKAEKGQLIDSGDLPMLPDNMKFIDEFLFYEVKGDGKDDLGVKSNTKIPFP